VCGRSLAYILKRHERVKRVVWPYTKSFETENGTKRAAILKI